MLYGADNNNLLMYRAPGAGTISSRIRKGAIQENNMSLNPNDYGDGYGVSGSASLGIDGTPTRVATLLIGAGAVLALLKLMGIRFNVGVTS